ncbi:MAG: CotH kinase family protein [Bacteroidales bacterium]
MVIFFLLRWLIMPGVSAQPVINEVCPRNSMTIADEDGDFGDWIELYNPTGEWFSLAGWSLSDNITNPGKWQFPDIHIAPDSFLVVFASGKERKVIVNHWETAIHAEEDWQYWLPDGNPDPGWNMVAFDDSLWQTGPGGFGRGDGDDNTVLPDSVATVYIRKTFMISDTSVISKVLLHVDYDDAFVAYLNGTEIARANIGWPGKADNWDDFSYDVHPAQMFQGLPPDEFMIDMDLFRSVIQEGHNVLAITGFNAWNNHGNSSLIPYLSFGIADSTIHFQQVPDWFGEKPVYLHTGFRLSGAGEGVYLFDPQLNLVDLLQYPAMQADHSFGRTTDASVMLGFFGEPTPGRSNNQSSSASGYAKTPLFDLEAGFYQDAIDVGFVNFLPGDTIRYTVDGSRVTDTSHLYQTPVLIDSTTVMRARVFKSGLLPGKVSTHTYFISEESTLPVVSISLNPYDLWDWVEGIYVLGPNASTIYPFFGANFWQDWAKESHVEYFDEQQSLGFELDADLKIHGGYSRALPMKSVRIISKAKYDPSEIAYPLYPGKDINTFNKFILRNSGQDYNVTHFRDALMHDLISEGTHIDYQAYRPVVVFLNGAYWGVHNMREKIDRFYLNENFGVHTDSVDLLRVNHKIMAGDYNRYMQDIDYIRNIPSVDPAVYDTLIQMVDIDNYTDYFIAEMYYVNADWPNHNTKYWRERTPNGRWRYILNDVDFGLGLYSSPSVNELYRVLHGNIQWAYNHVLLRKLMPYQPYRQFFINRSADLFNTVLHPGRIVNRIEEFRDRLEPEMERHFEKWDGSVSNWETKVNQMISFVNLRRDYVWQHYMAEFNLWKMVLVNLAATPPDHGKIRINTITPGPLPWEGWYFDGNPVTLEATPDSGYLFSHWGSNQVLTGADTLLSVITLNVDTTETFIAYFVPDTFQIDTPLVVITEINYRSADTLDVGDWIELLNIGTETYDLSGWIFKDGNDDHAFILPDQILLDTGNYLVLCQDSVKFKTFFPDLPNVLGPFEFGLSAQGEPLRLFDSTGMPVFSMTYSNQTPWPVNADKTGRTIQVKDVTGDFNDGTNWFAGCILGSPCGLHIPCDTVSVASVQEPGYNIEIFPNPASGELTIRFPDHFNELGVEVEIFNLKGILVFQQKIDLKQADRTIELNISNLNMGVYIISIRNKYIREHHRIIVR